MTKRYILGTLLALSLVWSSSYAQNDNTPTEKGIATVQAGKRVAITYAPVDQAALAAKAAERAAKNSVLPSFSISVT